MISRHLTVSITLFPQFCGYYWPQTNFGKINVFTGVYLFTGESTGIWRSSLKTCSNLFTSGLKHTPPPNGTDSFVVATHTVGKHPTGILSCVCKRIYYVSFTLVFFRLEHYCQSPDYLLKMKGTSWKMKIPFGVSWISGTWWAGIRYLSFHLVFLSF